VSDDLHSPTTAGPTPAAAGGAVKADLGAGETAAPPPVSGPSHAADATGAPGTTDGALLGSPSATERPEVQAGMAFAGGLLVAMVLRRITR
jgi:hypothetical protein